MMQMTSLFRHTVLSLATLGICLPQRASAAPPPVTAALVTDVALDKDGTLHGQVLNTQRSGVPGSPVTVRVQDHAVAAVMTGPDGRFSVPGLRGGVYELATVNGHGVYRLWSPGTAPPIAQPSAIVYTEGRAVDSNVVVYTQAATADGSGGLAAGPILTNPIFISGLVAAGIATPVALSNRRAASP